MTRATVATPVYLSFAWILMISYQLFTQTAVTTVVSYIDKSWPFVGAWLTSRTEMIVFIYAFSWVFVLSSAIPSVILGKQTGVLIQFFVCLTLTFAAFLIKDLLATYGGGPIESFFSFSGLFHNPFLAVGYLSIPYALMLILDVRSRKRRKKEEKEEKLELETVDYSQGDLWLRPTTTEEA